jgi:DNA-binding NarL/FixJ family response regulator
MADQKLRILLAEDDRMTADGMVAILRSKGFPVTAQVSNGLEAIEAYRRISPDITFMDIAMPIMNGIDATRHIIKRDKKAKIIAVTGLSEVTYVKGILAAGAMGFVHKAHGSRELLEALFLAIQGGKYFSSEIVRILGSDVVSPDSGTRPWTSPLTETENRVLCDIYMGKRCKDIAGEVQRSHKTIEKHVHNICVKLGAKTIAEMMARAIEMRIILPRNHITGMPDASLPEVVAAVTPPPSEFPYLPYLQKMP